MATVDRPDRIEGRDNPTGGGEDPLAAFARILRDELAGEHGGAAVCYDNRVVAAILPGISLAAAMEQAERSRARLASQQEPAHEEPGSAPDAVTASIGIAQYQDSEPMAQFVHRAASALTQAKQSGRNRVVADVAEAAEPHA
jgi:diguanylate cyclase (GGDEF)-like protein